MDASLNTAYMDNQYKANSINSTECISTPSKNLFSALDFDIKSTNSDIDLLKEIEAAKIKKTITPLQTNNRLKINQKYKQLGEWVGIVEKINKTSFVAKLRDSLNPLHSKELAEFHIDDILNSELTHLKVGAIFYWTVGYKTTNHTKYKVSNINFRKALPISNVLKEKAQEQSKNLFNFFSQY